MSDTVACHSHSIPHYFVVYHPHHCVPPCHSMQNYGVPCAPTVCTCTMSTLVSNIRRWACCCTLIPYCKIATVFFTLYALTIEYTPCKTRVYHVLHYGVPTVPCQPWYPISDAAVLRYPPARSLQYFCCMLTWLIAVNFMVFCLKTAQTICAHFDINLSSQLKVLH